MGDGTVEYNGKVPAGLKDKLRYTTAMAKIKRMTQAVFFEGFDLRSTVQFTHQTSSDIEQLRNLR